MEGDGGSGNLLDLTSTENRWSVERELYQFKISILTIIWWVYRFFMSGASACLTLYIIQAIKWPLTGLAVFLLSPTTVLIAFWEWGNRSSMLSFSTFLPFSCCLFLIPRAAQKQISHFKKLLYFQFPMFWGFLFALLCWSLTSYMIEM